MTEDELRDGDFEVVAGSVSASDCFGATVIDKSRPVISAGTGKPIEGLWHSVCECHRLADARMIAEALALKRNHDKMTTSTGDRT